MPILPPLSQPGPLLVLPFRPCPSALELHALDALEPKGAQHVHEHELLLAAHTWREPVARNQLRGRLVGGDGEFVGT